MKYVTILKSMRMDDDIDREYQEYYEQKYYEYITQLLYDNE